MLKIYLYNTLSRQKEEFLPLYKEEIGVYTCGPTVYNYAHIGNLRSYIFADLLVRILRYNFLEEKVKWVMNVTDVDDKTIKNSKIKYPDLDPKEALRTFTKEFEDAFLYDMEKLNINKPDIITNAADIKYISRMQMLIKNIIDAGFGYIKDGSVYFDVIKYSKEYIYGRLINIDMSGFKAGLRVDMDEYEKENVQDFVLWKGKKEGEPSWDFELNGESLPGRPGWHIECSAMGEAELGCPFDIHTGGIDLKFPHHENEICQSVIGYKQEEPVRFWVHNEHLMVDGQRMGKRFNNFYTLRDLEKKEINFLAFRYLCFQTHYGKQMNFTFESLKSAEEGLDHLYNQIRELGSDVGNINEDFKNKFLEVANDDLNISQALAVVQEVLKSDLENKDKLATVLDFDKVLGLDLDKINEKIIIPEELKKLVEARQEARMNKNFQESDRLRDEITNLGYNVEDTKDGQRLVKK
jgi:cysteinyl-tRNA synthetase